MSLSGSSTNTTQSESDHEQSFQTPKNQQPKSREKHTRVSKAVFAAAFARTGHFWKHAHDTKRRRRVNWAVVNAHDEFVQKHLLPATRQIHPYLCTVSACRLGDLPAHHVFAAHPAWIALHGLGKYVAGKPVKSLCSATPNEVILPENKNELTEWMETKQYSNDWEGTPFHCPLTGRVLFYYRAWDSLLSTEFGMDLDFHNQYIVAGSNIKLMSFNDFTSDASSCTLAGGGGLYSLFDSMQTTSPTYCSRPSPDGVTITSRVSLLTAQDRHGKEPLLFGVEPDPSTIWDKNQHRD
ncbi:unnamed protein product [Amoebophrya sp. A120]|nr:unnamed protein product [Amoebophrya sp. A120]|eukprot:GSA120T00011913001.1